MAKARMAQQLSFKLPNKVGQPVAEVVEPRAGTKGNVGQQSTLRT